ncbi:34605_t:CDS:2, partial [Racocetra persica]
VTFNYNYLTNLDIKDNILIDDNDQKSVIKHTISRIKQLRPPCELTDVMIELYSLVPLSHPDDRIVLLGDSVHAMNPRLGLGVNNALQDADLLTKKLLNYENDNLTSCIQRYNEQMRTQSSKDVMASRSRVLRQRNPKLHLFSGE